MVIHNTSKFTIQFGDANSKISEEALFLKQIHSSDGVVVTSKAHAEKLKKNTIEGDFLITNQKNIPIGVKTADCLPIVLYDPVQIVVAVIHAGWRGSMQKILPKTITTMQKEFGTEPKLLNVFFGPSIQSCCYEVGKELLDVGKQFPFFHKVVHKRRGKTFFDLPGFNENVFFSSQAKLSSIIPCRRICTACDSSYFSYRRDALESGRQQTVVFLKDFF